MTLRVQPVSGRSELSTFISLPRKLYARMPGFVPPLDFERKHMLHPKHAPLFDRAQVQYWIAWRGDKPVGRISAQVDPVTLEAWGEPIGMFGCLDAVDDAGVVAALLRAASQWLAERGMKQMRGPFTLSINGEPGLMVEGQDAIAMIMSPWHPRYLGPHVEAAGLSPIKDLLAFNTRSRGVVRKLRDVSSRAGQISLRVADLTRFRELCETVRRLFNDAWQSNWGFVPLTEQELDKLSESLRPIINEDLVVFAEKDGETIAFTVVLPNLYDVIADMNGKLWPLNWLKFAWRLYRRSFRSYRVIMIGMESRFKRTLMGGILPLLMLEELVRLNPQRTGDCEMGWVLEDNARVIGVIKAYGGTVSKRYRLYEVAV